LQSSRQVAEAVLQDSTIRRKLITYARSRFGLEASDAEELLQETAFELVRHENQIRDAEAFVFVVFRTRCAHLIRGRRRREKTLRTHHGLIGDEAPDPAWRLDSQILLREAFSRLSPKCRRLLSARYLEGKTLRESAKIVSLKYLSVRKTLSRCLQRLRGYLK
jgi:RNA polymerase sigma factor (sigma-70 family)